MCSNRLYQLMNDRQRTETGEYVETVTAEKVLSVLESIATPVATATEVGEKIGCTGQAARKKLDQLHDTGDVERKTVGARAVVWWLSEDDTDAERTIHEQAFEEFASRAMEAHGDQIEEIILFGSTARGETRGIDSDVDVFVVVETMEIRDALGEIAYDVMHEYGVVVAEVVKLKELVEDNPDHPFLKNVRSEGRAYA
jgi:predicted nucleotidyltransferase